MSTVTISVYAFNAAEDALSDRLHALRAELGNGRFRSDIHRRGVELQIADTERALAELRAGA